MAYTQIISHGSRDNMVRQYVTDTASEIAEIHTDQLKAGSTVFVISENQMYMLNQKKEWIKISCGSGGGSGGGSSDDYNIIWNGGDEDTDLDQYNSIIWNGGNEDG